MKIIIVGAGVSGMLAASLLKEKYEVTIIEKNSECGKKILATGNGKCNFWHENLTIDNYETDNKDKLNNILSNQEYCLNYLFKLGIYPTIRDGYYYPNSKEASSIRDVLVNCLKGVNILLDETVNSVNKIDNGFMVKTNKKEIYCDKVIIATGSKASVKECNTYDLLKSLKHTINRVEPALVKLKCNTPNWDGVRTDAFLTLLINGKKKIETNMRKIGAFLGDYAEVGCNSVLNPGTIIGPHSIVYPLTSVRGVIPANKVVKDMDNIVPRRES